MTAQESNLSTEEAVNMIINQEGVELLEDSTTEEIQHNRNVSTTATTTTASSSSGGFVPAKRAAPVGLEDVEDRVAKLRKIVEHNQPQKQEDGDEIDLDDIEADDDDGDDDNDDDDGDKNTKGSGGNEAEKTTRVRGVSTKQVPAAVFGGLAEHSKQ
eukprot:CAMPEP_0116557306 /NCGR_PEP_ID=MMETSP0397-20121206/9166_1 /TAXON_ID=216820 /ORGANISM="Cyclophora tenuis, Strain ECT3854" /LENGTH=156 /DNA_ID=CAMNT_0004082747 /DNA_START=128 /DNA_END=601 /DNA_ORIENTATION=+